MLRQSRPLIREILFVGRGAEEEEEAPIARSPRRTRRNAVCDAGGTYVAL